MGMARVIFFQNVDIYRNKSEGRCIPMREATLEMSDGFLVHAIVMKPEGDPVGHIHLLHGMSEHIGRYEEFAHYLVGKRYTVSGHDHRGHGKTAKMNGMKGRSRERGRWPRCSRCFRSHFETPRAISVTAFRSVWS